MYAPSACDPLRPNVREKRSGGADGPGTPALSFLPTFDITMTKTSNVFSKPSRING